MKLLPIFSKQLITLLLFIGKITKPKIGNINEYVITTRQQKVFDMVGNDIAKKLVKNMFYFVTNQMLSHSTCN